MSPSMSFSRQPERNRKHAQERSVQYEREARIRREFQRLQKTQSHDPFEGPAIRGIEGILTAHRFLLENNQFGVLVGGLAEENYTGEDFHKHKDVDIVIPDPSFSCDNHAEGLDIWLTKSGENGYPQHTNGRITLDYCLQAVDQEKPGLCIPDIYTLAQMKRIEAVHEVTTSMDFDEAIKALDMYQDEVLHSFNSNFFMPGTDPVLEYLEDIDYKTAWEQNPHTFINRQHTFADVKKDVKRIEELSGMDVEDSMHTDFKLHVYDRRIPVLGEYKGIRDFRFYNAAHEAIRGGSPKEVRIALKKLGK